MLAIGQKAAYFTGTSHFVNMVEDGGLYGYGGILELAAMMEEAAGEEKDTEKLIQVKGWGAAVETDKPDSAGIRGGYIRNLLSLI